MIRAPILKHLRALFALVVIGILVLVVLNADSARRARDISFFSSALSSEHADMTVTVGGTRYEIDGGFIQTTNGSLSDFQQLRILQTAYALLLARRSPLFGIAGVDPDALDAAVADLSKTQQTLADAQKDPLDTLLVGTSLYPIDFLHALASAERARRAFIVSGSDADAARYALALETVSNEGTLAAARFQRAFSEEAGTSPFTFPTPGGMITSAGLFDALDTIEARFAEDASALSARERCLAGDVGYCDPDDLNLTIPEIETSRTGEPAQILERENPAAPSADSINLSLSTSTCLGATPGPYAFTFGDPTGVSRMPLWYSGNFFFNPTKGVNGPTMEYLRNTLNIDYALINPLEFYVCPDVLADMGKAYAMRSVLSFAQSQPQYAAAERASILSESPLLESDVTNYVNAAATEIRSKDLPESDPAQSGLEDLLNIWNDQSEGLDTLVSVIATVDAQDALLYNQGVPFDISARTLFLTHSAFPSLLLAQNGSAGTAPVSIHEVDPADIAFIASNIPSETSLLKTVPKEKLLHDMNAFNSFEGISAP